MHDEDGTDIIIVIIGLLIWILMIAAFLGLTAKGHGLQYESKPIKIVVDPDVQTITDVNTLISVGVI